MGQSTVHIVHCIDTEGPLYEPLRETFGRLYDIFGLEIEPTLQNLRKIQNREIDLGGIEDEVAKVFSADLLAYNDSWDKVDKMLEDLMSPAYRNQMVDSFGQGWVYNWFCLDFVGFKTNRRRRDAGFHNIFDHYAEVLEKNGASRDGLHFHHHPIPFSGEGHHCATHYFSHTPIIFEILARRIIDRQWFPNSNRPGFHTTRPDSHWLMEQHIPFDIANQSCDHADLIHKDLTPGRFGDWRRAPKTWRPYHPNTDDYQVEGNSRRWIARCLNIGSRLRLLGAHDVDKAFSEAAEGKPVVLAFTHHDFRDMRPAIEDVRTLIKDSAARYPGVNFRYCEAREAMREALRLETRAPIEFSLSLQESTLRIEADAPTFGPQPFLALKTRTGQYFHDNLDFEQPFRSWSYFFDESTFSLDAIEAIGVGAADATGNVSVSVLDPITGKTVNRNW